jgi:hypothetical protein
MGHVNDIVKMIWTGAKTRITKCADHNSCLSQYRTDCIGRIDGKCLCTMIRDQYGIARVYTSKGLPKNIVDYILWIYVDIDAARKD